MAFRFAACGLNRSRFLVRRITGERIEDTEMSVVWMQPKHFSAAAIRHPNSPVWRTERHVSATTLRAVELIRDLPLSGKFSLGVHLDQRATLKKARHPC